ncbi:unnamed protein product [Prunus brigantina]
MQPHGIVAANSLQPSSSALQLPSAAGIAEQPPHDPGTSIALQSPAPITGAALPHCPAVGAQQQPHHSTTGLAAQPYGYSDVVPVLEQIHSLPPLRSHLTYAPAPTLDPVMRRGGHTSMLVSSSRGPRLVRQGQTGRGESEIVQTRRRQLRAIL